MGEKVQFGAKSIAKNRVMEAKPGRKQGNFGGKNGAYGRLVAMHKTPDCDTQAGCEVGLACRVRWRWRKRRPYEMSSTPKSMA